MNPVNNPIVDSPYSMDDIGLNIAPPSLDFIITESGNNIITETGNFMITEN